MELLGHYEFGLLHKSWNAPKIYNDTNNLNYWLEQWYQFYNNIISLENNFSNIIFIKYENLENKNYLSNLYDKLEIKKLNYNFKVFNKSNENIYDIKLYQNCLNIYNKVN